MKCGAREAVEVSQFAIISPTKTSIDEAYRAFQSALQLIRISKAGPQSYLADKLRWLI
jgi:hypothetical protein